MRALKVGLKLWSTNIDLISSAARLVEDDLFQYIELTSIPGSDISPFLEYEIPYVIHITTERYGLNIADPDNRADNIKTINDCLTWADQLDASYCILHPGFGDFNCALRFLENFNDHRLIIENMPKTGINDEKMVGYLSEQIEKLMNNKFGFCFDINHAIKAAVDLKVPYYEFIKQFLPLNPVIFHIADGRLSQEKDEHMQIGEGDYDFSILMDLITSVRSPMVTLETPRNLNSLSEDLINRNKIISYLM